MKMMNIIFCLSVFVLGCNFAAAIIHEIINEKNPVILRCPGSVEGTVMWSRVRNGVKTDIITIYNDVETKHISDPYKCYSTLTDKSLRIQKVKLSDSGRYFCNNEAVVDLTVIPSGINILNTERTSVTLTCPPDVGGSDDPKWSTDAGEIPTQRRIQTLNKALIITELQRSDSGLYYCDGKPAVYLNVIREDQSDREGNEAETTKTSAPAATSATPTTTKKQKPKKKSRKENDKNHDSSLCPMSIRLGFGILYLIIMISITASTWRKARQIERRCAAGRHKALILSEIRAEHHTSAKPMI
ncbi:uncharacterized protein LOC121523878 isoform X2 [Cheilinus undulatus]|uniref:uncharacterized protein LOC121523878 isoform X2 n=1 Tax=Cheilinus undulatus TaxID=241271 RepID=UPI001BD5A89F|nr:uncharacterized protein LOC121523878 isoform X2 [Cheilinus undulatus]